MKNFLISCKAFSGFADNTIEQQVFLRGRKFTSVSTIVGKDAKLLYQGGIDYEN